MTTIHPGSIQSQVGACMGMIHLNIEQQDMPALWNFIQQLQTLVSPYFEEHPDIEEALEALANPFTLSEDEAFRNMMRREALCLKLLHRESLFGYAKTSVGESRALYEEVTP